MKDLINKLISSGIEESEAKQEISILYKEFSDRKKIEEIVNKRIKTRKPLQYILGNAYFMDFIVDINEKVLIPRPETEILVEETVKRCRGVACNAPTTAIDIGTGSGIIPIALCKMIPGIEVIGIDVEKEIINLAYENAKKNGVEKRIKFEACDLFSHEAEKLFKTHKFNLIISNPPYICRGGVTPPLQPEITHEPKIALSGTRENKNGMVYYERIIEFCCRGVACNAPTLVALEIDPPIVDNLKILLKKNKLTNFEIVKDYRKLDRCLFVYP